MLVQRRTARQRPPEVVSPDPQALARGLDKALVRGAIRAQKGRDACQSLSPDDPGLDPATLGRVGHHGGDTLFQEVDVLNGGVRLEQANAHGQGHALKLRFRAGALRALDGRHSSAWRSDAGRQPRVRRALVEVAWSYRHPARVTERIRVRLENLPKAVREIAWKAQVRLSARYRRLIAAGKKAPVAVAAIAREMAAFLWAIGRVVEPA